MRKFITELFTNRFGIVLAALNLCSIAANPSALFNYPRGLFTRLFFSLNSPALLATGIVYEIAREFLPPLSHAAKEALAFGSIAFFTVLQWLFIAWIAKTLAARIQRPNLS